MREIPRQALLTAIVLQHPDWIRLRLELFLAEIRVARVVLRLESYREARGALPAALMELTPDFLAALPEDPFSGAPLVYARDGERFTLYGVGPDGVDDGGLSGSRRRPAPVPRRHQLGAAAGPAAGLSRSQVGRGNVGLCRELCRSTKCATKLATESG